ncbi:MAG: PAS domain S-box protein [Desulfobacteraceae bacterium]|nr:PAS domain S-box protein [Desulfobacteraceae bacterium]
MNPQKDTARPSDDRIQAILVTQVYARSNIGILATVVNASILVLILLGQIQRWKLVVWFSMVLGISLVRLFLNLQFFKTPDREAEIRRWGRLLWIGLGAMGLLWGSTAIFLFPANSVAHQVFVAFVLAGMVAGAVGVFSPLIPVFLTFSIPALAPITIRFLMFGDALHLAMGAMTVLFALLTFTTAKRINSSIKELVVLKETFADQLVERTDELQRVNTHLREEIEEREQAEQALANSERRLTDIIEFLPDPTWVIDTDGKVIAWNRAVERITGIDKKDMIGRGGYAYAVPFYGEPRPMLIDLALRRDAHWEKDYLSLKEEAGVLVASESFHPSMEGGARYFASTASRLYDAQENVIGSIESIRDITAAKRLEKERERLIGELQGAIAKIRTLSGLLPICASCKKIRDDKGYWNQIETFIRDHSEAEFSHGICPDCARKLYPDLDFSSE